MLQKQPVSARRLQNIFLMKLYMCKRNVSNFFFYYEKQKFFIFTLIDLLFIIFINNQGKQNKMIQI